MIEQISLEFKDEQDRNIILLMLLASIFFYFLPTLIVILFFKDKISETSKKLAISFFNFEILMIAIFIVSSVLAKIVPTLGQTFSAATALANMVFLLMALIAISKNETVKVPTVLKIMK